jgi:hypothetical protein
MQETISKLLKERSAHWKTYEDSWSDEKMDYSIPEPKEIDELGKEIRNALDNHTDELDVDFVLESLTKLGCAPQVIYDDNGHFAISGAGMSPVPMTDSGKFESAETFTAFVEPDEWYDTIREALNHYLKN